jgi:hypothetical protein
MREGTPVNTDQFWTIIDATATGSPDDMNRQAELLRDQLSSFTVEEILGFDEEFTQASQALYSWTVWRAADIMIGDTSDDVFADFRSWVISRGRRVYERVLASPDDGLAEIDFEHEDEIGDGELFGAVVGDVYQARTGVALYDAFPDRPVADFPDQDPLGPEIGGKRKERRARYPRLTAKYESAGKLRFPWRS